MRTWSRYWKALHPRGPGEGPVRDARAVRTQAAQRLPAGGNLARAGRGGVAGRVAFMENVFAPPGIGTLAVRTAFSLDIPMIWGTVLFRVTPVVSANRAVDVLYR